MVIAIFVEPGSLFDLPADPAQQLLSLNSRCEAKFLGMLPILMTLKLPSQNVDVTLIFHIQRSIGVNCLSSKIIFEVVFVSILSR